MRMGHPKHMSDMRMLRRIADKAPSTPSYLFEQLSRINFVAEFGVHPIGKLLSAFFFGHRFNLSTGSQCVARFPSWQPRHSVRAVLLSLVLSVRRLRVRGRRTSPLQ